MKTWFPLVFLFAVRIALADDFVTIDGKTHSGTLSRVEPDGIVIMNDTGIEKISFAALPAATRAKYGYDPARAAAFANAINSAAVHRQEEARQLAAQQQAASEAAAQDKPKTDEKKILVQKNTGMLLKPAAVSVDQICENPFSLRGYALEMIVPGDIDKSETAEGVYKVTFGIYPAVEATLSADQLASVAATKRIYVKVKQQEEYSKTVPVEALGSAVTYDGLSTTPTFYWK